MKKLFILPLILFSLIFPSNFVNAVAQTTDYYSYGGTRTEVASSGFENDYLYNGKELDEPSTVMVLGEEDGLYYYGGRYYDAEIGRFVSADPAAKYAVENLLGDPQSLNLYAYARNNPMKYVDPDGQFPVLIIIAWAVVEVAMSAYDAYTTVKTVANPNISRSEKAMTGALFIGGLVTPGGGYATAAKKVDDIVDGVKAGAKAVDRALDAGKAADKGIGGVKKADDVVDISKATNWGRPETLEEHFLDHGSDFGAKNSKDYAQKGKEFLKYSQKNNLPTKITDDGIIHVYEPSTNTFGAYNPDGSTRTFYKPDPAKHGKPTNLDYWNSRAGTEITQKGGGIWSP